METEKVFKTKTGFCHILSDKIIITRNGVVGEVSKVVIGNSVPVMLLVYGVAAFGLFFQMYLKFQNGNVSEGVLFAFFGIGLIINVLLSWNNVADVVIERQKIK